MSTTPLELLPLHHLQQMITAKQLDHQIDQLVYKVGKQVKDKNVSLIHIDYGAAWFATKFREKLQSLHKPPANILTDHFRISSYAKGMESNGKPYIVKGEELTNPEHTITDQDVILLEDIIDLGLTIATAALPYLLQYNPKSLRVVAMLTKFQNLKVNKQDLRLFASGPNIDYFAVGSRLDWEGNYRELSGIHKVILNSA